MPSFVSAISTPQVSQTASEANTPPQHQVGQPPYTHMTCPILKAEDPVEGSMPCCRFKRADCESATHCMQLDAQRVCTVT